MEKIRELSMMLQTGIDEYEEQQKMMQQERLKYMRLAVTNTFGDTENDSRDSWLLHLRDMEETLNTRRNVLRQAIKDAAAEIIQEEEVEKAAEDSEQAEVEPKEPEESNAE